MDCVILHLYISTNTNIASVTSGWNEGRVSEDTAGRPEAVLRFLGKQQLVRGWQSMSSFNRWDRNNLYIYVENSLNWLNLELGDERYTLYSLTSHLTACSEKLLTSTVLFESAVLVSVLIFIWLLLYNRSLLWTSSCTSCWINIGCFILRAWMTSRTSKISLTDLRWGHSNVYQIQTANHYHWLLQSGNAKSCTPGLFYGCV